FEPFFGFHLMQPERDEVVVFKYPGNSNPTPGDGPRFPESGPQKNHVPINYIKRCIGMGGETIGIWYGKLYVSDAFSWYEEDKALLERIAQGTLADLQREEKQLRDKHRALPLVLLREIDRLKLEEQQQALAHDGKELSADEVRRLQELRQEHQLFAAN